MPRPCPSRKRGPKRESPESGNGKAKQREGRGARSGRITQKRPERRGGEETPNGEAEGHSSARVKGRRNPKGRSARGREPRAGGRSQNSKRVWTNRKATAIGNKEAERKRNDDNAVKSNRTQCSREDRGVGKPKRRNKKIHQS